MSSVQCHVEPDKTSLADVIASRLATIVVDAVHTRGVAHVVLTGGSMGSAVLEALARRGTDDLPLEATHFWWGDERFLPEGHEDRNVTQARETLLGRLPIPPRNLHVMPASDGPDGADIEAAARRYAHELDAAAPGEHDVPDFTVVMLGMGPDTHVASLFPGYPQTTLGENVTVTSVEDSPKPPPRRITMTFSALNAGRHVWLMVSGPDKAEAVRRARDATDPTGHPASGVHGRRETLWWLDSAAAGA